MKCICRTEMRPMSELQHLGVKAHECPSCETVAFEMSEAECEQVERMLAAIFPQGAPQRIPTGARPEIGKEVLN